MYPILSPTGLNLHMYLLTPFIGLSAFIKIRKTVCILYTSVIGTFLKAFSQGRLPK